MTNFILRDFQETDTRELQKVAVNAFMQFNADYADWDIFEKRLEKITDLATAGELIVAEAGGRVIGGVAYLHSSKPKQDFFDPSWSIIRMLVVDPTARGLGIGRALTDECVRRARRDHVEMLALHTTPIMEVALSMYLRMGFRFVRDAPPIHGVPYGIYTLQLRRGPSAKS